MELEGKVAVVTGGASGIGRALGEALGSAGAEVVLSDIHADRLAEAAADIGAIAIAADVSKAADMEALAGAVVERFGRVDILCSNAGIGPMAVVADLTLADWRWMIDVNLWGTIHTLTSFLPLLRANPDGTHIVATASMAGLIAAPGLGSYCLTKFGLVGLMETLSIEMAAEGGKVGVSILCPGPVRSNLGRSTRSRPTGLEGALADIDLEDSEQFKGEPIDWLSAEDTARLVLDAIRGGDRYVITHPAMLPAVVARHRAIEAAFASAADRPPR